mgnify:FL=1
MKHGLILVLLSFAGVNLANALDLESNQLRVNGHTLHYYQAGTKGTPLILLTGYATTSNFWNSDFVECLAASHRVYLMDYAGINSSESTNLHKLSIKSMATDVNKFSQKLKLKQPALIGWSMGGGVALEASFMAPKQYRQLYLISPIVPVTNQQQLVFPFAAHGEFKSESDVLNYVFNNNLYHYESASLMQLDSKFIVSKNTKLFPNLDFMPAQGEAIYQWTNSPDTLNKFRNAKTPAVFFIPQDDVIIDQKVAESMMQHYPQAKIEPIESSGHAIAWQYPLEMCHKID